MHFLGSNENKLKVDANDLINQVKCSLYPLLIIV